MGVLVCVVVIERVTADCQVHVCAVRLFALHVFIEMLVTYTATTPTSMCSEEIAHTHTRIRAHTYMHICTHIHAHTHMLVHSHTHAHTHTCTHTYAHTHAYTHAYTHALYIYVHTYTHTHTHTQFSCSWISFFVRKKATAEPVALRADGQIKTMTT